MEHVIKTFNRLGCVIAAVAILSTSILSSSIGAVSAQAQQPARVTGSHKAHALYGQADNQTASTKYNANVLHLKLNTDNGVHLEGNNFVGGDATETAQLNSVLQSAKRVSIDKLVKPAAGTPTTETSVAVQDYYKVTFGADTDIVSLAAQLEQLSSTVIYAYPEAKAVPTPSVPLYSTLQSYLRSAPNGVNADQAAKYPGGSGSNSRIIDVEYSWNTSHRDLAAANSAALANGTPVDPFNDNSHGTAVLGEMVGTNNASGVTGTSPGAQLTLINVTNAENGYDVPGALVKAASVAKPGDVVIIEQQSWGTSDNPYAYLPIEWIPEVYDAIRSLTDAGITVVEPAANGGQDLDNIDGSGQSFPMGKPDSGAIMVGAGEACDGSATRLSRLYFSNYGSRVDLQGPGDCVTTTGYGDLYSAGGANNYYTKVFNGTSSATPIIASTVAVANSVYESLNGGASMMPSQVRYLLRQTATPQAAGDYDGNIGGLPNLQNALAHIDVTPPTAATLKGSATTTHRVSLSWSGATDNAAVASYQIYRNGALYKTVSGTSYVDTAVTKGKTYSYKIMTVDITGYTSTGYSNTVKIKAK